MDDIAAQLEKWVSASHASSQMKEQFRMFLATGQITRNNNAAIHACVFFVPIHTPSKSLFLVHHKKAKDWIPPGGHIENSEHPIQTIMRESGEELGYIPQEQDITFYDISIKTISNPYSCKVHYDFWFTINMSQKRAFVYLKKEFFDARWFSAPQAKIITQEPDQGAMVRKIASSLLG